jgi:hypothetical protein
MTSQHHANTPIVVLDLIVIGVDPEDLSNTWSPSLAVLIRRDPKYEPIANLDHAPHPEEEPPHREMPPDRQAGLRRLRCIQPLHNIEKYNIEEITIIHLTNPFTCQPIFDLQCGNTQSN